MRRGKARTKRRMSPSRRMRMRTLLSQGSVRKTSRSTRSKSYGTRDCSCMTTKRRLDCILLSWRGTEGGWRRRRRGLTKN